MLNPNVVPLKLIDSLESSFRTSRYELQAWFTDSRIDPGFLFEMTRKIFNSYDISSAIGLIRTHFMPDFTLESAPEFKEKDPTPDLTNCELRIVGLICFGRPDLILIKRKDAVCAAKIDDLVLKNMKQRIKEFYDAGIVQELKDYIEAIDALPYVDLIEKSKIQRSKEIYATLSVVDVENVNLETIRLIASINDEVIRLDAPKYSKICQIQHEANDVYTRLLAQRNRAVFQVPEEQTASLMKNVVELARTHAELVPVFTELLGNVGRRFAKSCEPLQSGKMPAFRKLKLTCASLRALCSFEEKALKSLGIKSVGNLPAWGILRYKFDRISSLTGDLENGFGRESRNFNLECKSKESLLESLIDGIKKVQMDFHLPKPQQFIYPGTFSRIYKMMSDIPPDARNTTRMRFKNPDGSLNKFESNGIELFPFEMAYHHDLHRIKVTYGTRLVFYISNDGSGLGMYNETYGGEVFETLVDFISKLNDNFFGSVIAGVEGDGNSSQGSGTEEAGVMVRSCIHCCRDLTLGKSQSLGMGPTCFKKFQRAYPVNVDDTEDDKTALIRGLFLELRLDQTEEKLSMDKMETRQDFVVKNDLPFTYKKDDKDLVVHFEQEETPRIIKEVVWKRCQFFRDLIESVEDIPSVMPLPVRIGTNFSRVFTHFLRLVAVDEILGETSLHWWTDDIKVALEAIHLCEFMGVELQDFTYLSQSIGKAIGLGDWKCTR